MSAAPQSNVQLAPYTTLGVGGVADYVIEVATIEELQAALLFAKQTATPPLVLGGGSNVVLSDAGYRGVVIKNKITGRTYIERSDDILLHCGAGEVLDDVIAETAAKDLWGLENLSAIPGSVGATPIQNVGAYGVEVSQRIESVTAVHRVTGEMRIFSNDECLFSYRDSWFKTAAGQEWVVVGVAFLLRKNATPTLTYPDLQHLIGTPITPQLVRDTVASVRAAKFPDWHEVGTVGSFFKNPTISTTAFEKLRQKYPDIPGYVGPTGVKISLGWVLDKVCHLRGVYQGLVGLYENQALVLVVKQGATATDILSFSDFVTAEVWRTIGISIEREATVYTEEGMRV